MEEITVYDNEKRFIFNNWSNEDFECNWGGQSTLIKAGETKEFPMYLAYHFGKHFVDREMIKAGKSNLLGVEEERAVFGKKTIAEITGSTESPAMVALKEKIKKELEMGEVDEKPAPKKSAKKEKKDDTKDTEEFADIK